MPRIELDKVNFAYGSRPIIRDLSLKLTSPAVVGLVGRSGSGKTTLLKLLAGILVPTGGEIRSEAQRVSWVPQDTGMFPWLTIAQNIAFPLSLARQRQTLERRTELAKKISAELRLSDATARYPAEASGGEKQRAAIGRALAGASDLLLLDEPFASLDPMAREDLRRLLRQITATNQMITVFASHDLFDLATLCDFVLVIPNDEAPKMLRLSLPRLARGQIRSQDIAGDLVKTILLKLEPRAGGGQKRGHNSRESARTNARPSSRAGNTTR
jgi:NitT/TauT family transport system ATP-binding protein